MKRAGAGALSARGRVCYVCTAKRDLLYAIFFNYIYAWGFPGGSVVKRIYQPMQASQETWVQSLGRTDPLEGEMATHFSILAWRIAWTEKLGGLQSMGLQRAGHN